LIPVFKNVHYARRLSANDNKISRGLLWLYVRVLGTLINQVVVWFIPMLMDIENTVYNAVPAPLAKLFAASLALLSINGLIVLVGNKSLRLALISFYKKIKICANLREEKVSIPRTQPEDSSDTIGLV